MSDHLGVRDATDTLWARRHRLTVPAALATGIGGLLLGLSLLFQVLFVVMAHRHSGMFHHPGVTYVPPSRDERIRTDVRVLAPVVLGLALLGLTWRFRGQGRVTATWVCAVGVVLMGIVAW